MKTMFWFYRGQISIYGWLCGRRDMLSGYQGYSQELKVINKYIDNLYIRMESNPYLVNKGRNMGSSYNRNIIGGEINGIRGILQR